MNYKAAIIGCDDAEITVRDDPERNEPGTHAGALHRHPKVEIVAVCDDDEQRRCAQARAVNARGVYGDYLEMLARERPDILYVKCPRQELQTVVLDASLFGVQVVLSEHFLPESREQAQTLVNVCEKRELGLVFASDRNIFPFLQPARQILASGKVGALRSLSGLVTPRSPDDPDLQVDNPWKWERTHRLIDLFLSVAGEVSWVVAHEEKSDLPRLHHNGLLAMLHFSDGCHGFIEVSRSMRFFEFDIDMQCTHGRILLGQSEAKLLSWSNRRGRLDSRVLKHTNIHAARGNPYTTALETVIDCLEGRTSPLTDAHAALNRIKLIEAIRRSVQAHSRVIRIGGAGKNPPLGEPLEVFSYLMSGGR